MIQDLEMRSSSWIIQVSPKSYDKCPDKQDRGRCETYTKRRWLGENRQAWSDGATAQEPRTAAATRSQRGHRMNSPSEHPEGTNRAITLILGIGPPELRK